MWFIGLDPVVGSEQAKMRPCVVVQRDAANRVAPTTIVVPFTDAARQKQSVIKPLVRAGDGGLTKDSIALCHQVRCVDRLRFVTKVGHLSPASFDAVNSGLREILDLAHES